MAIALRDMILPHVERADLAARMAEFYADIDRAVAGRAPVCRNRGDCCKFGRYGHVLYVTNVELVYFVHGNRREKRGLRIADCGFKKEGASATTMPDPWRAFPNPPSATVHPQSAVGQAASHGKDPIRIPQSPIPSSQSAIPNPQSEVPRACPYQVGGRCTARPHRPLGCRVFTCDPGARAWQGPESERGLAALKRIGEAFGIAYRYTEWLSALRALGDGLGASRSAHNRDAGIPPVRPDGLGEAGAAAGLGSGRFPPAETRAGIDVAPGSGIE